MIRRRCEFGLRVARFAPVAVLAATATVSVKI